MQKMQQQTLFALAPETIAAAIPALVSSDDEDKAKMKLPNSRYDEIHATVLKMYEKADARLFPLSAIEVAQRLGCLLVPYRAWGKVVYDALMKTSRDAVTVQFLTSSHPLVLYNDRLPIVRQNFSIMHEIGHIELGHKEQSGLAEFEANHFSAVALCPVDMLDYHQISTENEVTEMFNVSKDCARNRLSALNNSRGISRSFSRIAFRNSVIARFGFKKPIQPYLYGLCGG